MDSIVDNLETQREILEGFDVNNSFNLIIGYFIDFYTVYHVK